MVCLTANSKCGSWMYCDTVWIDSAHLGGSMKTKNLLEKQAENNYTFKEKELMYLLNYPNPFDATTTISYALNTPFQNAEIIITSVTGQTLHRQSLSRPIDTLNFDANGLSPGLYYLSMVADGKVKGSSILSVIR